MFNIIKSIWSWLKFQLITKKRRRKLNKHNKINLSNECRDSSIFSKITIWNNSIWTIDARFSPHSNSILKIWSYCSIATWVQFLCWIDHQTKHFSTFPFWYLANNKILWKISKNDIWKSESICKWPIIIDDDVRIWMWAKIMSWVHVSQWAVIAAWAVVTKDIPPYAIVWWVPAKIIKYRFSDEIIEKLLKIDYNKIPIEKFREIYPETIKENFNIDYILDYLKDYQRV